MIHATLLLVALAQPEGTVAAPKREYAYRPGSALSAPRQATLTRD